MCGVSYHAVLRAIERGDLKASRVFNRLRITSDALETYFESMVARPASTRVHTIEPSPARPMPSLGRGSLAALRQIERRAV